MSAGHSSQVFIFYIPLLPRARKAKSGVKQLVPVCLSYQFMIEEKLIKLKWCILNMNQNMNQKTSLPFYHLLALS